MFALKWWSTRNIVQSQRRAQALRRGCELCTLAVYTCLAGGTCPGKPGLPDTATGWERLCSCLWRGLCMPGYTQHCEVRKWVQFQISTKYNMNRSPKAWGEEGKDRFSCRAEAGAVLLTSKQLLEPGCCPPALGSAWGRLACTDPAALGCSASLAGNSCTAAAVIISPNSEEKPSLSPAAGTGPATDTGSSHFESPNSDIP